MTERHRPEDDAQYITVSDPVQHVQGMNKYTSYRVDVRGGPNLNQNPSMTMTNPNSNSSFFENPGYSAVLRRYSDFLWLYEQFHREKAGAIVPPLPEKQPVGRFSAAFIEDRRTNLERFLRRVAVHPELMDAQCLNTFLRADDATFHATKHSNWDPSNPPMPPTAGGYPPSMTHGGHPAGMMPPPPPKQGLTSWLSSASSNIASKVAIHAPHLIHSPDDDLFLEIEEYIAGLEHQMKTVSQQATTLVRKGKEMANGLFEYGLAFSLLGQSEEGMLGVSLQTMGEVADQLSVMTADHSEKEGIRFEDPLTDYIKMIQEVKIALQKRQEKKRIYSSALMEVKHKETQSMKWKGIMGKEEKSYQADMALQTAKEFSEVASEEFATVSQRVLREVDRFKREKADDMRRTVMDYIDLQIDYNRRMEEVWAGLVPQLESVSLDASDTPVPSPHPSTEPSPVVSQVPAGAAVNAPYM